MATLRPFRGLPAPSADAAAVASRPYDVLNSDEARLEAEGNPLSFLHVGKPEIDLLRQTDLYDDRVYAKGRENLQRLITDGILLEDPGPVLRLRPDHGRTHAGGLCRVRLGRRVSRQYDQEARAHAEGQRRRPHPAREGDRSSHRADLSSPTAQARSSKGCSSASPQRPRISTSSPPTASATASGSFAISPPRREIREAFRYIPVLYVADGHHRSAAAARVGSEMAKQNASRHTGEEEYNFFLAVLFPHTQLKILDYNRVVKDLNGRTEEEFLDEIAQRFTVTASPAPVRPSRKGEIGMYLSGHWYRLERPASAGSDPVASLEVVAP